MFKAFINKIGVFRLHCLAGLAALFLIINLATRLVLHMGFPEALPASWGMARYLGEGLVNDAATLAFALLLPAAFILLPTNKFLTRRVGRVYCLAVIFGFSLVFIFTAFAEYFFWDEFGSRFNFIAVDYLIYTTEMLRNIVESYPLTPLLLAVAVLAALATTALWRILRRRAAHLQAAAAGSSWRTRVATFSALGATAGIVYLAFTPLAGSSDRFWNQYAKNGTYEIFSAYFNNELDYRAFYPTMDKNRAFALMRGELGRLDQAPLTPARDFLVRKITGHGAELRPNVIVVIMESLGREWLEEKGRYTPNLQALAAQGLSFSRMMSTGTRTVRGIEAVMLSVPPTPGNSIVRRPDNGGLFNLGALFADRGYDLSFIYGGIGYFDNMGAFFRNNGYRVVDKPDFAPQNKTFATAWGQCDQDLYAESLDRADASFAAGKPFQQVLLTTSNHRPFTYPAGLVGIEPGTSRRGAVAYSDYAIGEFIRAAKEKPWFDNTVFVFVGDHPSAIAGKTEIPADAYGIACIMYGPRFFRPEAKNVLCSQIDVAPTLLAALNWSYDSQFFGSDARVLPEKDGRAWISTYQLLGFRTNESMVVLSPDGKAALNELAPAPGKGRPDGEVETRGVASYQCAYDLYVEKRLKAEAVAACAAGRNVSPEKGTARAPLAGITGSDGSSLRANGLSGVNGAPGVPGVDGEAALLIYLKALAKGLSAL